MLRELGDMLKIGQNLNLEIRPRKQKFLLSDDFGL